MRFLKKLRLAAAAIAILGAATAPPAGAASTSGWWEDCNCDDVAEAESQGAEYCGETSEPCFNLLGCFVWVTETSREVDGWGACYEPDENGCYWTGTYPCFPG